MNQLLHRSLLPRPPIGAVRRFAKKRRGPPGSRGPTTTSISETQFRGLQRNLELKHPYKRDIERAEPTTLMQAQMYTPEVLKSENLALNCFRMVAYGLHQPEILDRYGERAAELAGGMKPDEFSKILTAFARAKHRNEVMLKAFTKYIPARLPQFLPMDLSQTCNAYAKLRERDESLFRRVSSEVPHKLPLFAPYQLKNVANAYARLGIRDDLLFDDIADEVMRRPEEFTGVDLYLLANAFSNFRICHPRLWLVLADWLLQTYLDLGAVEVSVLLNSMSTVGFYHDALLEALLRSLSQEPLISGLDASTLTLALNALARLQWPGLTAVEGAMDALAKHGVELLDDLDAPGIARLLHSCTKLPSLASHEALLEGALRRAKEEISSFNAQSLSLLVHCCAVLKRRDAELLTQVAKAIPNCIGDFTPQALAMAAAGYAKLEVRSEILFYLLAAEACEKMPLFTGQGVSMLLRAFGRLQVKNERLILACRKQVRALAEELTLLEVDAIESGFRNLGALDGPTEGVLRRQRRLLAESQATTSMSSDPWASEEDRLLHRLADRPSRPMHTTWSAQAPEAKQKDADFFEDAPVTDVGSPARPQASENPDLWDLWGSDRSPGAASSNTSVGDRSSGAASSNTSVGSGGDEATSSSRLREYLARPERIGLVAGRRSVVVDSPRSSFGNDSAAFSQESEADRNQDERRHGRKSRR